MADKKNLPWIVSTLGLSLNWSWMHKPSVFLDVCQRERGRGSCQSGTGLNDEPHNLCLPCAGLCVASSCPLAPTGPSFLTPRPPTSVRTSYCERAEERRRENGHWLHCSCKEGFEVLCAFQSVAQWAKMSGAKEAVCVCQWGRGEVRAARGAERHRNREWDGRERNRNRNRETDRQGGGGPLEYYTLKI